MKTRDKLVLVGSFVVTSAVGGTIVWGHWNGRELPLVAVTRSGAFVALMALVHWVAFRVYQFQPESVSLADNSTDTSDSETSSSPPTSSLFLPLASDDGPAIKSAVIQQVIFLVLGALMLDSGYFGRACCVATIAHWVAILLIIVRRPLLPTKVDLIVIRYTFLLILLFVGWLAPFVQKWVGTGVLSAVPGIH